MFRSKMDVLKEVVNKTKNTYDLLHYISAGKGKAIALQKLEFPDFMTTAQNGGKVVSLTHRPPLPPGNTPGTHFC